MNRVLLVFLTLAVVLALVPEGLAGLTYGHRYHKRSFSKKREDGYDLTPRYVGNVKRQSCRVRPTSSGNSTIVSMTQPVPSSSTQDSASSTPSAFVQPFVEFSPAPSPAPSPAVTPEAQQDPSPAPATTSEEPAPTTSEAPPPPSTTTSESSTTEAAPTASASSSSEAAPTASASPSSGSSSGTSQSDIDKYLDDHNTARSQHGAAALTWNDTLAVAAQQWANGCVFQHSGGTLGPYGENLAAGTGDSYGIDQAIKSWTDEASQFNAISPEASHFTQVVWKASTQVGCALQDCDGIFAASFGKAHYYVCEYFPQGNVIGNFAQNVQV